MGSAQVIARRGPSALNYGARKREEAALAEWHTQFVIPPQDFIDEFVRLMDASGLNKMQIARRLQVKRGKIYEWQNKAPNPLLRRAIIAAMARIAAKNL
jgi:hypothetical protein